MADRIPLTLYQHDETENAILLSQDGRFGYWIPKSLIEEPRFMQLCRMNGGGPFQKGIFFIEQWKAEQVGFLIDDDDGQEELKL